MESRNALKKKKKPARQGWIDAKDRYKGGLTREKPLDVICLNNTLKERKQNHLNKSRKAMDKIQQPLRDAKQREADCGGEGQESGESIGVINAGSRQAMREVVRFWDSMRCADLGKKKGNLKNDLN